jgi:2-methylcitrate dehydratase PrpD
MEHALGIAATQAGGLMASQYGSMVKRMHHGRASQSGLYAAILAKQGYTGIEQVFEQPYGGYCSTFTGDVDQASLELLTNGLGSEYRLLETGIKPYACSAKIHVVLDAIKAIRARRPFSLDEIRGVKVRCTQATAVKTGWQYRATGSATEAQLNMAYNVAVMLLEQDAFVDQYRDELLTSGEVLDLVEKVAVITY